MFSFIILHYGNIEDTITCLNCLNKIKNDNTHLIVVDNKSLVKTEEEEIRKYTNDLILLDENLGFAKANNIGIKYAKEKYNSKFYCVINNDVFINQLDFLNIIETDYKKYSFDMLGPSIDSPSGESVNPFPVFKTKETIEKEIEKCNKLIKIYKNALLTEMLNIYLNVKHIFKKPAKPINGTKVENSVALHGCAIVFSDKYINKYEYPFYNETFLFHEEEFLYKRVIDDRLISIYDPELRVFHKEGSSIKKKNKKLRLSKLFRETERLKSLELLLRKF